MIGVVADPGIYLYLEAQTYLLTAASLGQHAPVPCISYEVALENTLLHFSCGKPTFLALSSCSVPGILSTFCVQVHYRMK